MSKRKLAFNDRYKTEEILGRGQFGVVRKATDTVGNRIVAIKKIRMSELGADGHPKDGVEFTAIREIKILQELRHENVIQVRTTVASLGLHPAFLRTNSCPTFSTEFLSQLCPLLPSCFPFIFPPPYPSTLHLTNTYTSSSTSTWTTRCTWSWSSSSAT